MNIRYQAEVIHRPFGETFVSEDARIVNQNINTTPPRPRFQVVVVAATLMAVHAALDVE